MQWIIGGIIHSVPSAPFSASRFTILEGELGFTLSVCIYILPVFVGSPSSIQWLSLSICVGTVTPFPAVLIPLYLGYILCSLLNAPSSSNLQHRHRINRAVSLSSVPDIYLHLPEAALL